VLEEIVPHVGVVGLGVVTGDAHVLVHAAKGECRRLELLCGGHAPGGSGAAAAPRHAAHGTVADKRGCRHTSDRCLAEFDAGIWDTYLNVTTFAKEISPRLCISTSFCNVNTSVESRDQETSSFTTG
jgi:hypothetical protein